MGASYRKTKCLKLEGRRSDNFFGNTRGASRSRPDLCRALFDARRAPSRQCQ